MGQLVTDHTFMYRPAIKGQGFEVRGPQQVCERHGISRPLQVIDLLALEGDTADNIPGCPGVGEKTAQKLIDEFDSVENLLANTHKLKGALKTKVEENRDKIIMSKELATICTTVPTDIDVRQLVRRTPNFDALHALYVELEFKSLAMRLPASGMTKENSEPTAAAPKKAAESSGLGGLFDLPQESETSDKKLARRRDAQLCRIARLCATASRRELPCCHLYILCGHRAYECSILRHCRGSGERRCSVCKG